MRLNGLRAAERGAEIHEPSLTIVDRGLDRPLEDFGVGAGEGTDQGMTIPGFAGLLVVIATLKTVDKFHDIKAKLTRPRGEF